MKGAWRIRVDPTRCRGRGLCAEMVPELIELDDWGFPIVSDRPARGSTARHARRAVAACPELALYLEQVAAIAPAGPSVPIEPSPS